MTLSDRESRLNEIEAKLAHLESARSLALKSGDVGFWDLDLVRDHLWWSPEMFKIFGVTRDVWCVDGPNYKSFERCLHPDDVAAVNRAVQDSIERDVPYRYRFRSIASGEERWIVGIGNVEFNSEGRAIRLAGLCLHDYGLMK